MENKKGLIIYFDGPDGVGKTTQLNMAADGLKHAGYRVFTTKAVGGNPLTNLLSQALIINEMRPPETDLYIALASQHAIAADLVARRGRGEIVLVDRSPLSVVAYQVYGDDLDREKGFGAARDLLDVTKPDLLIVYTADSETAVKRRNHRNGTKAADHFESKPLDYHQRVAKGFQAAGKQFGAMFVSADGSADEVHQATRALIKPALEA